MDSKLKALRIQAGMRQEDLAVAAGVDGSYISLLERKLRKPSVTIALRIARALSAQLGRSVSVEELYDLSSSQATKTA